MSLAMGGENCTTDSGQPIALDDVWGQAADAGTDAAISSASGQAGNAIGNAAANSMGNSTGGSIAGSAIGAASREIMSGMFNKLGKKKDQPEPVAETAVSASATVTIFEITSELTGVDNRNAPDSLFVVPTGWKKVANNW
jgi:hypothetical protein